MASICFVSFTVRPARCYWIPTSLRSTRMTPEGPNRPEPQPLKLDGQTTAIVVLDLSRRCENSQEVCSKLMLPLAGFLERARQASVPIPYTISAAGKGTSLGEVAAPLKQRESEPAFYPDAFDKFMDGELKAELDKQNCRSLIIVGSA